MAKMMVEVRKEKNDKDKKRVNTRKNIHRKETEKDSSGKDKSLCPVSKKCGGCQFLDVPYEKQLKEKQRQVKELLKDFCKVYPIVGMEEPFHYRNKVHAVFGYRKGQAISGVYKEGTHTLVPVEQCMIEDINADEIISTIRGMLKSFKIRTYDEDTGYGFLRHVLVRRGFATGQVMVVLVTASPIFPSRNQFIRVLREKHPEITTIIQNLNDRETSMVLGDKEKVLYGKGYIEDVLCGCTFRISSKSFYQVNPVQTEKLYAKAIEAAGLTGQETVIDAYCGIGTIGIIASRKAGKVIGIELNQDAVRDAVFNARKNKIANIQFYTNDAGKFMADMAGQGERADVVFMDPPRSGTTEEFIEAVTKIKPKQVVYVSCNPQTLARDLKVFERKGYRAEGGWPFDLFPHTEHVECVISIQRKHI
ncbi:MAG: 23S rRNA (uracil(1939)-C(5))-methyltransferase RlmD [Hungatella sp.]|nr:23S rRNA (uracil(1939)-C(5))-methyltransferase RlmD [Hungatella sp.]